MVDKRGFDSRRAPLPVARPSRGQQEPAQLPCSRNFSQQQQPSNAWRSEQQQPSDVQRSNLDPAAQGSGMAVSRQRGYRHQRIRGRQRHQQLSIQRRGVANVVAEATVLFRDASNCDKWSVINGASPPRHTREFNPAPFEESSC